MRILGVGFLAISVHAWLGVFVARWRATFKWRWKRGPVAGRMSVASFGVMFAALGAAFAFGDWLVPQEYLICFAAVWLAVWLLSIIGGRLDARTSDQGGRERDGSVEAGAAPDHGGL